MLKGLKINPLKWIGALFMPIQKNSAFFVFMFALGMICTQLELMPVYLVGKGAEPYQLSEPELFLDIYVVCVVLTLIPRKVRYWVRALLYILLHGTTGTPYNVACEACNVQLKAFAKYCAEWAQKEVVFDLPSETEQKGYSVATRALLDTKRLQALGWAPHYAMQDAVNRTLSILRHEE